MTSRGKYMYVSGFFSKSWPVYQAQLSLETTELKKLTAHSTCGIFGFEIQEINEKNYLSCGVFSQSFWKRLISSPMFCFKMQDELSFLVKFHGFYRVMFMAKNIHFDLKLYNYDQTVFFDEENFLTIKFNRKKMHAIYRYTNQLFLSEQEFTAISCFIWYYTIITIDSR